MLFALHINFLFIALLFPPCMFTISLCNNLYNKSNNFHWLLLMHAIILYNLSHRLNTLSGDVHPNPGPAPPNSPGNLKNFNIMHLNIRSLMAPHKLKDLIDFSTVVHDFDIITLSETYLDHTITNEAVNIPGYDLYRRDRSRNGGGVCTYIKNIIPELSARKFASVN